MCAKRCVNEKGRSGRDCTLSSAISPRCLACAVCSLVDIPPYTRASARQGLNISGLSASNTTKMILYNTETLNDEDDKTDVDSERSTQIA